MNQVTKNEIRSYILDYLKKKIPNFKKNGKMFLCPKCQFKENLSCNIFPENSGKLHCFNPECKFKGDIFDVARLLEFDGDISDEEIAEFLKEEFEITTDEEIEKILNKFSTWGWDLVPIAHGAKNPIEQEWTKKTHKNVKEWKTWLESGLGIGVKCGEKSNIIILDIDLISTHLKKKVYEKKASKKEIQEAIKIREENYKKVKGWNWLKRDTVSQATFGGVHFIYLYDDEIPNSNFTLDDIHVDVQSNGSQVILEPSIVGGQPRKIEGDTISKLNNNAKEFLLKICENSKETSIQQPEKDIGKIYGLEGKCNNTFAKVLGMFRKFMPMSNVERCAYLINSEMLDEPMDKKSIRALCKSLEIYHKVDINEISDRIINHMKMVEEAHIRDLRECLNYDRKDLEQAVRYLCDHKKLFKIKKDLYRLIVDIEWQEDFLSVGKPLEFKVPFLDKYNDFGNGSLIVIGAGSGDGKCFAKGTRVLMYDGTFKKVENLKKNDKLMGVDSTPRNVLKVCYGKDIMYKIESNKGDSFTVNSEHILSLKRSGTNEILNIKVIDFLQKSKSFQNKYKLYRVPIEFKTKPINLDPYFLGLWLGDGDNRDSRICNPNIEIQNYIKSYAKQLNQKYVCYDYQNRCLNHKIARKNNNQESIKEKLNKLNLLQNKHIPFIYKTNNRDIRLKLLAGLLDADGYCKNGQFEIITKYNNLAEDIKYLARSLGFLVTHKLKRVNFAFANGEKFRYYHRLKIIGDCSIIPTKVKKAYKRKINKNHLLTGFKITKLKEDNYYGFFLDGDHLHLLDNFIVNHNTHLAMNFIRKFVDQKVYPRLISTETGSKFNKIAQVLKLKEGDFGFWQTTKPCDVKLPMNGVTIIDWLKPKDSDYAKTDAMYESLNDKLTEKGGLLIAFAQVKKETGKFYGGDDMIEFYASFVAKLSYKIKDGNRDWTQPILKTQKMRDSKIGRQFVSIPFIYNQQTKLLEPKE